MEIKRILNTNLFKKSLLLFLLIGNGLFSFGQNWFENLPGWRTQQLLEKEDTLIVVSWGNIVFRKVIFINYISKHTGTLYRSDTCDYSTISGDTTIENEYRGAHQAVLDDDGNLFIGMNYEEVVNGVRMWRSAIFQTKPFRKLSYELNHDFYDSVLEGFQKIDEKYYAIIGWRKTVPTGGLLSYDLFRLNSDSTTTLIRKSENTSSCYSCHQYYMSKLYDDKKSDKSLFMVMDDYWNFRGQAEAWDIQVVKFDTSGKTIWTAKPNQDDSTVTTAFVMIQKENGNLLCTWLDDFHPEEKSEPWERGDSFDYGTINRDATIWFAEIDYNTGAVLWRKNIRNYLITHYDPGYIKIPAYKYRQRIYFAEAVKTSDDGIIWTGSFDRVIESLSTWKYRIALLKTDENANPIWYREHDLFPDQDLDKGMLVLTSLYSEEHDLFPDIRRSKIW